MFHGFDHSLRIEGEEGSSGERFGGYKLKPGLVLPTAFITSSFKFSIPSKISRGQRKQCANTRRQKVLWQLHGN
jgi:hypothetical protein